MVVYLLGMGSPISRSLKQDEAAKCHRVPNDLQGCDLCSKQKHGAGNQQDVLEGTKLSGLIHVIIGYADLEDASECQNQSASGSHQEHSSDVE